MSKDYFKYLIHSNQNLIAVLFMACFLIYPFMIFFVDRQQVNSQALYFCFIYATVLLILTFCVPIYLQNKRLKKRSVDTFYALPIKKEKMVHSELLFGLFIIFVPWIINYFLGIMQFWIKERSFASGYEFYILGICLIYGFIQYSINYFLAGKCNNMLDGIITVAAYNLLPFVVYVVVGSFLDSHTVGIYYYDIIKAGNMSGYAAMYSLISYCVNGFRYSVNYEIPVGQFFIVLHVVLGILAYAASCHDYVSKPLEEAEQKTTSIWAYRFLIPFNCLIYLSLATYNNGISEMVIVSVLVFLGYLVATFISNREIKITSRSVLFFATVLIAMNAFTYIFRENHAFGINESFPKDYDAVEVRMYLYNYLEEGNLQANAIIENLDYNEEIIEAIQNLQVSCIDRFYEGQGVTVGSLWISYENAAGKNIRSFSYSISKGDEEKLLDLLEKNGYEIEIHSWDTKSK